MGVKIITALIGLAWATSVFGVSDSAQAQNLNEILECRSIPMESERLSCFDKTTDAAAQAIASSAAENDGGSQAPARMASNGALTPEKSFGAEDMVQQRAEEEQTPKSLRARLVGLGFTQAGRYIITLDNGQVWRQIAGDTDNLRLPNATGDGVPIIIRKGMFGSHLLRPASSKRTIRVERIK
ncbi:hypothetical protein [Hyphococcus sp.]|uniref:hypothetical protein n=1 Tax=Hyphococcus sp. TaxID=2038636 RepID=UPI003CCBCCDC